MAVLDELTPADDEMTNILLAHAGNHGAIPIDYPTIRKAGFDYIGLGHEASYKNMYNGRICYPGVLEPDNNRETGPHGYVQGKLSDGVVSVRLVPASQKNIRRSAIRSVIICQMKNWQMNCIVLLQEREKKYLFDPSGTTGKM